MKVLVTGVSGQLGHDVMIELQQRGCDGWGTGRSPQYRGDWRDSPVVKMPYISLDITDKEAVCSALKEIRPDAVIHCAAWTAVDLAEEEKNKKSVWDINVQATKNIAAICNEIGCKMMYISTDYVFNGQGIEPWKPDCEDYAPLNIYGKSKLEGELVVKQELEKFFVVRISWVFGKNGKNFVKTMLNIGKKLDSLKVVNDQIGTPTYTKDLARLLVDMVQTDKYGCYHATNEGEYISWYDFACEIFRQAKYSTQVVPVTTLEYGLTKAKRPKNSRLDKSKLLEKGFEPLPNWQDALNRYLKELQIEE